MTEQTSELSREELLQRYSKKAPRVSATARRSPFKFLDSYDIGDADIFFGRDWEIDELLRHFHCHGQLLIYGESGCGKSSIVQCGLRSRIPDADALFIPLRVHTTGLPTVGLQVCSHAADELGEFAELQANADLVEILRARCEAASRPLVLFFDQFEELFIFHDTDTRRQFAEDLLAIQKARLNVKVIIGIRQDYLAHLSELEDTVEGLFDNRYWLRRMSRENAAEAVVKACNSCDVKIDAQLAQTIIHRLDPGGHGIELPYLQVVMDRLYRQAVSDDPAQPVITVAEVEKLGDIANILAMFLVEEVAKLPAPETGRQILKAFVTHEGTRRNLDHDAVAQEAAGFGKAIEPGVLDAHLNQLVHVRVLREIADSGTYELRHDALAATVASWISQLEKQLIEVRDNLFNRFKEYEARGRHDAALLDQDFMDYLAIYRLRLAPLLDHELHRYLEKSQERLRTKKRKRQLLIGSGAAVVMLVGLSVWSVVSAERNRTRAESLVEALLTADITRAPDVISELGPYRQWTEAKLRERHKQAPWFSSDRLRTALALLPGDEEQLEYLTEHLLQAPPAEVPIIVQQIARFVDQNPAGQSDLDVSEDSTATTPRAPRSLLSPLWSAAMQVGQPAGPQRLRAACALAALDPHNPQWSQILQGVADQLVSVRPAYVAYWQAALRPVGEQLAGPLAERCRNMELGETERALATDLTVEYAAHLPSVLIEAIQYADAQQFAIFFEPLQRYQDQVVGELASLMVAKAQFDWNDPPLDPSWSVPTAEVAGDIERANGMLAKRFAFCQRLPLDEFESVCEALRKSGYRPIRIRPYAANDSVHVAAAWTRDNRDWQLATGQAADAIEQQDQAQRDAGFVAVDVAGYIGSIDDESSELFAALWVKRRDDSDDARFYAGVSSAELTTVDSAVEKNGFEFQHSLQGFRGLDGQQKYCGVKTKATRIKRWLLGASSSSFETQEYLDKILWDIDLSSGPDTQTSKETNEVDYAALWNEDRRLESLESHGLTPSEHLATCQAMLAKGYRIASISTASINDKQVTASVWHRPLVPELELETLARRQANAAVAALRMGQEKLIWPLLKHSPDPRLRTWIIHRLNPLGASADSMVKRLDEESDVSIRRALILILGEYGETAGIDRIELSTKLLALYRNDPDPGIRGASEWVLRRWDRNAELLEIDAELAAGKVDGERGWYVTTQGQTMVLIPGPSEFVMGASVTDAHRRSKDPLYRKRIGRSFAIASKEVTVRQFQEFLRQTPSVSHSYNKKQAPVDDCPQITVTWYNAAAYCRWLSEQEMIPEDQMCYPKISEIKQGMQLPSDYLSRTGYRLPSEAEWEYACRSGSVTSRYYGETEELLGQYAWYQQTSGNRAWPVGSLKPNDTGLFDMLGNPWEWCQERFLDYSESPDSVSNDREDPVSSVDYIRRALRGGSFEDKPFYMRSAARGLYLPDDRSSFLSFRLARTYNSSP